ncbi:hypothetical protein [Sulfurimonas sp.]
MNKILAILTLSFAILSAGSISINSPLNQLDNYKYETPHGRQMKIPKKTNLVIVAFEKDTGALVNEYLKTKNKYYLQKNRSIFIADIHEMPDMVTTMFALPKLKKYKHLIYLHYDEEFQKAVPYKKDEITLLRVVDGKVSDISYITSKSELQASIER